MLASVLIWFAVGTSLLLAFLSGVAFGQSFAPRRKPLKGARQLAELEAAMVRKSMRYGETKRKEESK